MLFKAVVSGEDLNNTAIQIKVQIEHYDLTFNASKIISWCAVLFLKIQIRNIKKFMNIKLTNIQKLFSGDNYKKGKSEIMQKLSKSVIFHGL